MRKWLTILAYVCVAAGWSQSDVDQALAKQYYTNGNYEKAAEYFENLWKKDAANTYYYSSLFHSLLRIHAYEKLEDVVKKQIKTFKKAPQYKVDLGYTYAQLNESDKADKEYQSAIDLLDENEASIRSLANKFLSFRLNNYVIETYLKGNKLLKSDSYFAYELGDIYLQEGNKKEAIDQWMNALKENAYSGSRIQYALQKHLEDEELFNMLAKQLYGAIQKSSSQLVYPEMLIWLYTQKKDFESALIQAKALDKRNQENGSRIFSLGVNAVTEEQYDAATEAFSYVLDKGETNPYYQQAKINLLRARKLKITSSSAYQMEDILALKNDYQAFLHTYGYTAETAPTIWHYAEVEALYLHNLDTAISILNYFLSQKGLPQQIKNETKLNLGDYYVLQGDVWEATLIYAQVDKEEKDSPIGEDARFRNARLSYYKGEFEWAQAQLTVLKGATTELIANDALALSVFIMDNLGLDTSATAMNMFARAELLALQNKKEQAISVLDSIPFLFPGHALYDDVLFRKAAILREQSQYEEAAVVLEQLLMTHAKDVLGDDATFALAELYELHLHDLEKAQELYKKIITDYTDSVLATEARKRFRILRGDDV